MRSWLAPALVAFVAIASLGSAALAQTAAPPAAAKAEARERFDRGLGLFEKGENAAALAEFKRAYELIPNAVVLYNMGLVYAAMNRPVEASDTLDRYLAQAGDKASSQQRAQATKVRDEQSARVARVLVVTDHPATVQVDGVEAGRTPMAEPLRVASGAHTIAALAPGYQPTRRELTLAGQVTETVTLALLPTETGAAHLVVPTPLPGVGVWIDDKQVGTTPLPASVAVTPGDVRVELKRDGYRTASRVLHVDPGSTAKVDLTPEEDPAAPPSAKGMLRLNMAEWGATEIAVDGASRAVPPEGLALPAGAHTLRVQRAGYQPYGDNVQIDAGRTTPLAVDLVPTVELRARDEEAVHGRRVLAGSLLGGGLAIAVGSAIYVIATHSDVSNAQATLNTQLGHEKDPLDHCYAGAGSDSGVYGLYKCAEIKSADQDAVDAAKLKRTLGYVGIGVGAVVAGVGGYLLSTAGAARGSAVAHARVDLWAAGQGTGLSLSGAF